MYRTTCTRKFQRLVKRLLNLIFFLISLSQFDILFHICGLSETNSRKELWLIRLMYLNTQINPWLYVILRRESLRRFFVLILKCKRCLCEKEEQTTGEESQDSGFYQWKKGWLIRSFKMAGWPWPFLGYVIFEEYCRV